MAKWTTPNPRSALWTLEGTPYRVFALQDRKTFVAQRVNAIGNPVTIRKGFRKLDTAQAFCEHAHRSDMDALTKET